MGVYASHSLPHRPGILPRENLNVKVRHPHLLITCLLHCAEKVREKGSIGLRFTPTVTLERVACVLSLVNTVVVLIGVEKIFPGGALGHFSEIFVEGEQKW